METKLIALKADRDMVKIIVRQEHQKLRNALTQFVRTEIVEPTGSHLSRLSFRNGFHDDIEVTFELSFLNAEGKEDFGSDCWFEYNHKGLNINHGTIGSWTKDNVFQIRRIKMLSYVCDIIPQLEAKFQEILDSHKAYTEKENELWHIESEISQLENMMKRVEVDKKMMQIHIGSLLCYPEKFHPANRLFSTNSYCRVEDLWKVVKMGEKTITLVSLKNSAPRRISKEDIRAHLMNTGLEIINEN